LSNDKFIVQDGLTINTIEVFTADGVLIGPSGNTLNASYSHANSAYDQANLAFDTANTKVNKSGDTMTGDLNIDTANVHANVVIVNQTLYSGLATAAATPLPNVIAQFTGNTDSYVQVNTQNIDPFGSADFVVTADIGTDEIFYIDMGLNGSDSYDEENASAISPLDGYLYVKGSDVGQEHGNLILGTSTSNTYGLETKIVSGGLNEENVIATFSQTGLNVKNDLYVTGDIAGPTIVRIDDFAQAAFNTANAGYVSDGSAYAHANGAFNQANSANVLAQAAFERANTSNLTISLIDVDGNISNVVSNVNTIRFDTDSGFDEYALSEGIVKIALNSTFKYWEVNDVLKLTANGLDTVNFKSANGITIDANGASTPQSITFDGSIIYNEVNSAISLAQAAFETANAGYVSDGASFDHANGAFDQANTANVLAQAAFDKANTGGGGGTSGNSFGIITSSGYDDILANTANSRLTFYAQTGIAIGNDVANSVISIGTNLIGASNVILDYGNVIDYLGVITFDYGYLT
jgi:hypothetical protein